MSLLDPAIPAVRVESLQHRYGERPALVDLDLTVSRGELFVLLGPNGGGKSTLFRILSTLLRPTGGRALVFGDDVVLRPGAVRRRIGVVFQSPAVDRLLTVRENLEVQGRLYGLGGTALRRSADAMLERLGLVDRARDRAGSLSGGLMRRVEIAKGLLHRPQLFLLDEPTTGLDPAARQEVWDYLREARDAFGVTVLVTTHLMDEAERCDRLAILDQGRLVACGAPRTLKEEIGGDVIVIRARDAPGLCAEIGRLFSLDAAAVDGSVRLECPRGHQVIPKIVEAFPGRIESISLGRPTLSDVFARRTGHRYAAEGTERPAAGSGA